MSRSKKGFTIVELVIVIAVVAILAAVLIPSFSSLNKKAKDSAYLQERTNQQIADLAEKVENQDYLTWEDLEAKLAEKLAALPVGAQKTDVEAAVKGAVAELEASIQKNNSSLTEAQVKAIVEKALEGQLTTAQVEAIVTTAIAGLDVSNLNADQVQAIVNAAVKDLQDKVGNVGITAAEMETAITNAISGQTNLDADDVAAEINKALAGFGYGNDISASDIESIVKDAIQNANDTSITVTITLDKTSIELDAGKTEKITETVTDGVVVAWSSSDATVASVDRAGNVTANAPGTAIITATTLTGAKTASCVVTVTSDGFVAGLGTEASPFIISTADQLQTINDMYEQGYTYFKVADGITSIDCTGWPTDMKLNGSFDGNGATLVNLSTSLFDIVGDKTSADVVLENFKVQMDGTTGNALVRNIASTGTTTFRNIELYGTVEGTSNVGSFYNYGTANRGPSGGADYTINFENAKSYLTLICTTSNPVGGMIGHTFPGTGHIPTINIDANSGYFGKAYVTGDTSKAYAVAAIPSGAVISGATNDIYPSTKLTQIAPTKTGDGTYTVEKQANVDYYVVTVHAQVTSYDEAGVMIPNKNGITLVMGKNTIENPADNEVVFEKVDSGEIVNELLNGQLGYAVENGVIKVYVGDRDAGSGAIRLQVAQYDVNGNIISTGIIGLDTISK